MTIPIALLMGMYMYRWRAGNHRAITEATIAGVILLILAVVFGKVVQGMDVVDCLTPRDPSVNPNAPPGDAIIDLAIQEVASGG